MAAVRVYEFSKKVGVSSKDLLDRLKKAGFHVASHMSVLPSDALSFLEKEFIKVKPQQKVAAVEQKTEQKPIPRQPSTHVPPAQRPVPERRFVQRAEVEKMTSPSVQRPTHIEVRAMTVEQLAAALVRPVTEIILSLLKKGVMATKNQVVPERAVVDLVRHYGLEPIFPVKHKERDEKKVVLSTKKLSDRKPVIVVMGHVDHGKTTLLDFIRKTRVAAKEKGGITQHLGAYEVDTAHGGIVFLDTPGHEAFSQIRMRGAKVADIAVLVVAADDSVKPQTVEALKHAQAMNIPIVVAVNKIDKVRPERVDVVKRDLAQYNLLPEEWGGQTIFVPISAKLGTGIDQLLEILALQSQIMELKADSTVPCRGIILESKIEKGRGSVATLICQEGTASIGDFFVCGQTHGKINAMINSRGQRIMSAGPSVPVQIAGFEDLADVGDLFEVVVEREYREARAHKGERKVSMSHVTSAKDTVNFIVKAEGNASREALLAAIHGLSGKDDKAIHVVHSGIGAITESDVILASNTGSIILGLHVRAEVNAAASAQKHGVTIKLFDIIYQLLDEVKQLIEGTSQVALVKQKIGEAVVRKIFDIKGLGVIAGCYVKEGRATRDATVVIWRGKEKVGQGKIKSLQREKRTVKEIQAGFECAFIVEGFNEWQEDDRVEFFIEVPQT